MCNLNRQAHMDSFSETLIRVSIILINGNRVQLSENIFTKVLCRDNIEKLEEIK